MEMHVIGKILVGISLLGIVAVLGFLGFEITTSIISLVKGVVLTRVQLAGLVGIGIALGVIITVFTVDVILSLWQASENKEKFELAIAEA